VVKHSLPRCDFFEMPSAVIDRHRARQGGYYEIVIEKRGDEYRVKGDRLPKIKSFTNRL
jgi:hypothetical protein